MEAEVAEQTGAGLRAQRGAGPYRNGYRPRTEHPGRELELAIPKLRRQLLPELPGAAQALRAGLVDVVAGGLRQRRVDPEGGAGGGADGHRRHEQGQVSRICQQLDERVEVFRQRPLEGGYPYLWLDAKVERVREPGRVRQKALLVAYGVHETGRREVIGVAVGEVESEAEWRAFLRGWSRGLVGVQLCSPTPTKASRTPSARCWAPMAALRGALRARHAGPRARTHQPLVRGARSRSSPPPTDAAGGWPPSWPSSPVAPKVARLLEAAEEELLAYMRFPPSTGPSSAAPTRWSGSTARSPAAPTWWGSSPTTPPCCAWPAPAVEQNDEWLIASRYLSQESLALVLADEPATKEVAQLTRA